MKSYSPAAKLLALSFLALQERAAGFMHTSPPDVTGRIAITQLAMAGEHASDTCSENTSSRRQWIRQTAVAAVTTLVTARADVASAEESQQKMFAPGGTLVDYQVGVTVGNDGASRSRRNDNSNVIFGQDYYYKFGTAPKFIPEGDTSFPVKMPFVLSQQRYDGLKKYRDRVQRGIDKLASLGPQVASGNYASIPAPEDPEYSIRPMGLLANSFLASENTGTTNELFLARWYINEIYLDIGDVRSAPSQQVAEASFANAVRAMNSYLGMLNRSITSKVGDPFVLVGTAPPAAAKSQPVGDA
mmetsp:Transcript_11562/g.27169  ORF Transcript_11562/g.27169 Transcript_11562/m.27169 type:complete len:301 (-) Transcript_11562:177-1079(-)